MLKRFGVWMAMAAVAVFAGSAGVMAQSGKEFKTIATVSVASGDSLMWQLKTFGDLIGENLYGAAASEVMKNPEASKFVNTAIDGSRPAGLVVKVSTDGFSKQIVGFVPVKSFDAIREFAEDTLKLDVKASGSDGLYTLSSGDGKSIYAKTMGGWLLLSDESGAFGAVGANPAEQLDGLDREYAFAVRFQPCNVPSTAREILLFALNQGLREMANKCPEKSPEMDAVREKLIGMIIERVRTMFTDTESATYGVRVSATQGLRFTATGKAVEGSGMAKYFAKLAEVKNPMGEMLPDTTAISAGIFLPIDEQKTEMRKFLFGVMRKEISKKLGGEAEKIASEVNKHTGESITAGQVTAFVNQILDAHAAGIEAAEIRGGFAVIATPERPTFFATTGCNGKWAEELAGQIWGMAVKATKKCGKCPVDLEKILTPNVAEVNGASVHLLSGPTWAEIAACSKKPGGEASVKRATELFGERPSAAAVFSPCGVGIVIARDPVDVAKSHLAEHATAEGKPVLFEGFVSLRSMISLAKMIHPKQVEADPGVSAVLRAIGDQPDRVTLKSTAEGRSVTTELKFDTGFIRGIAAGVKASVRR